MTNEEDFAVWAPDGVGWSQWAKPALFAHLSLVQPRRDEAGDVAARDLSWLPDARGQTVLVIDLPAGASVAVGLAAARRGFRPVPLYNTCLGPSAAIDCEPIARNLTAGVAELRTLRLSPDAPPAFLLDSNRRRPVAPPAAGKLDNRWVVFAQDFPSATYLRSRAIGEAVLIHDGTEVQEDLAHVLLRWQQGGITLLGVDMRDPGRPREVVVKAPSLFRRAWYRALLMTGLRRNDAGGFGSVIPLASRGGGGFA